jgi:UDP-3-O-[3-hydroxymyristoyl] glucosamine N-acyltransferase LpxD
MKNYNLKINDNEYKVQLDKLDHTSKTARVIVNGTEYIVEVDGVKPMPTSKPQVSKATYNAAAPTAAPTPAAAAAPKAAAAGGAKISSPLPGTVLAINVKVGDNVTVEPFVIIKGRVKIGNNVVIRSGSVIGAKGFSFSKDHRGNNISVTDVAKIVIEDNVEIFEQVVITTGLFPWEVTLIGENTKIDGQGFVAHGTHIGKNCLLAGGCKCCGNCKIGNDVWIGPGAVVSNRVEVGDGARVSIGSIATKNVPAGEVVTGNFAINHQRFMQNLKGSIKE